MKQIELSDSRKDALTSHLQTLFATEFDENLSRFRADEIVELFLSTLAPIVYNQAVQDVRAHFQTKLDDLEGEVFVDGPLT